MALRLRRGTDAQRQLITPVEGEIIYVTDTKELYVGDGSTSGGIRISGEVVDSLNQLNDVDAALPQDGDVLIYDSITDEWTAGELPLEDLSNLNVADLQDGQSLVYNQNSGLWVNQTIEGVGGGLIPGGNYYINIVGGDSTLLINADQNTFSGDLAATNGTRVLFTGLDGSDASFIGDVTGDVTGNLVGDVTGDVTGTLRGDIEADDGTTIVSNGADSSETLFTGNLVGDVNGNVFGVVTGAVIGTLRGAVEADDGTTIISNGATPDETLFTGDLVGDVTGNLFGDVTGDVLGDVTGNLAGDVTGNVIGDIRGSVFADDSTIMLDAVGNNINANTLSVNNITTDNITPVDPARGVEFITSENLSRLTFQRSSDSAIPDTTSVGRILFSRKVGAAEPEIITSISVTNDQISFIPQPGGTPNYSNYFKIYKDGKVQISMPGELSNAPTDHLEVGGNGSFTGKVSATIVATAGTAPSLAGDPGDTGEIRFDDSFIYIKTPSGDWKKVALSSL